MTALLLLTGVLGKQAAPTDRSYSGAIGGAPIGWLAIGAAGSIQAAPSSGITGSLSATLESAT